MIIRSGLLCSHIIVPSPFFVLQSGLILQVKLPVPSSILHILDAMCIFVILYEWCMHADTLTHTHIHYMHGCVCRCVQYICMHVPDICPGVCIDRADARERGVEGFDVNIAALCAQK